MSENGKRAASRPGGAGERGAGRVRRLVRDESGIIVFGGGNGCAGRGCLFWIVLSIVASVFLTVLANFIFVLL